MLQPTRGLLYVLKQTYYGAINYRTGIVITKEYPQGNTENTITFVAELIGRNQNKPILIISEGATYHRRQQWKEYLDKLTSILFEVEPPIF